MALKEQQKAYVPAVLATLLLNLSTACITPHPTRRMLLIAGIFGIAFIPYSFSIHPTMNLLKQMDKQGLLVDKANDGWEAQQAVKLMDKWETLHAYRTGLCGLIWVLCLGALIVK